MKLPLSWLNDFVNIDGLSVEEIATQLTLAGLEVQEIKYVGMQMPDDSGRHEFKTTGIAWDEQKLVVAEIREVKPHPNADRLVLCELYDGVAEHTVLTGAPNLFEYKGTGKLPKPIKVAWAKEGATLYDGHAEGQKTMTLKRTKIRGVESYSMVCSEKELGISEEHEGIIMLDEDAMLGMPLADYMGDAVLEIDILPNMARCASALGVARELAALTNRSLKKPEIRLQVDGDPIEGLVKVEITDPALNPRFMLGLIRDVTIQPSPYKIQRRLRLAGLRPINSIVDATNYAMLDIGQPLHAFDYDVLKKRAGKKAIKIITRAAKQAEKLTTLDGEQRILNPVNVLVCDEKSTLAMAGVMGGLESEVTEKTKNVLLEAAAWNFINTRRTAFGHNLHSEASFRFSRGVHPAMAESGLQRGLQFMAKWGGGSIAPGVVDEYPLKPIDPVVELTPEDVKRLLGIQLSTQEISELLSRVEFECKIKGDKVIVQTPPNRVDIGPGVIGLADVLEEIARLYGYDKIPETRMADELPPQIGNPINEWQEHLRDQLTDLGLQEVVSYRMTNPEREARLGIIGEYVRLTNPVAPEMSVLRRSLLSSVLDALESNARLREGLAFFEIGPIFEPSESELPLETTKLAIAMTGQELESGWDLKTETDMDFYDMKGRIERLLAGFHLSAVSYIPTDTVAYLHPGKAAEIKVDGQTIGAFGELHPLIKDKYDFEEAPILVAEFDLVAMRSAETAYELKPVPVVPPVLEDIALILDQSIPAAQVEALIRQTGGKVITNVKLFDLYHGEQVGAGKKSLAYSLTYQADKTLTDKEAEAIRNKIVRRLEKELGAKLRSMQNK
ncbi:MAG: phenylalanine--tRNA ligase subunit beta [Anaerolineae bacterium]|nr:phenylalanine--tRNA ligase subunit beta [Anaerolineae bacterium]MDK1118656.1 phenylalanine--tRNA ligase subunit beta [Anaerolineae bacterium]